MVSAVDQMRELRGCEVNGQFFDRIKMGLLREEWDARRQAAR